MPLIGGPPPFDFKTESGNLAIDWKNWLRGFEIFTKANGIKKKSIKRDWLLHYMGPKVQNIYFNLPSDIDGNADEEQRQGPLAMSYVPFQKDVYAETVAKLDNYFAPKQNTSYERHIYRKLKQENTERIDSFVMRLRIQANRCNFGDKLDENIKDQVTSGCHSDLLRRKILERGDDDLDAILKMARIFEMVSSQQKEFATNQHAHKENEEPSDINKIYSQKANSQREFIRKKTDQTQRIDCGRCGYKGHRASDPKCPAKGKDCSKCGKPDHFARKCRTRETQKRVRESDSDEKPNPTKLKREDQSVQAIDQSIKHNDFEDVFCDTSSDINKIWCTVGNIEVQVVVDSGSRYNIVDRDTWTDLKAKNIEVTWKNRNADIDFMAYGGHALKFLGMFEANIERAGKRLNAKFYVANEMGKFLLGFDTATALGVLKIESDINNIIGKETKPFNSIKDVIVDIPIDTKVKPVQQPYRRVPVPLEKLVEAKVDDLLRQGIIEQVKTSKWISPLVVVPKGTDVRVCVDMKRANEAVARENYPLPSIEDFLPELGSAKVFSKLDIKAAYHQV